MRSLLLALSAVMWVAQPALAQPAPAAEAAADPHERVYDTLLALSDDGPMVEAVLDWMVAQIRGDPNVARLAADYPSLLGDVRNAARPIIVDYSQRVKRDYRPRMVALLRAELSAADAAEIAEFYASPIGRRIVAGVSANYRPDTVLGTIDDDRAVTAADVSRDLGNATQATLQGLSPAETEELYREIAARPAMTRLAPVVPKLAALRAQMEEEPMTAEEEAAIGVALRKVFAKLEVERKGG